MGKINYIVLAGLLAASTTAHTALKEHSKLLEESALNARLIVCSVRFEKDSSLSVALASKFELKADIANILLPKALAFMDKNGLKKAEKLRLLKAITGAALNGSATAQKYLTSKRRTMAQKRAYCLSYNQHYNLYYR